MKRLMMAAWILASALGPSNAQDSWTVGEPIPDLRLPTIDGSQTLDLAELRGKKLMLVQFASW